MHRTAEQWAKIVEDFENSGLSQADYAREHGIHLGTMSWQVRKAKFGFGQKPRTDRPSTKPRADAPPLMKCVREVLMQCDDPATVPLERLTVMVRAHYVQHGGSANYVTSNRVKLARRDIAYSCNQTVPTLTKEAITQKHQRVQESLKATVTPTTPPAPAISNGTAQPNLEELVTHLKRAREFVKMVGGTTQALRAVQILQEINQ